MNAVKLNKDMIKRIFVILVFISTLLIMSKYDSNFKIYGVQKLDMGFGYSYKDVYNLFNVLGVDGREIYARYFCIDFVFIASFAFVQNYILKWAMGNLVLKSKWRVLLCISYFRGLFDILENIIILVLLANFSKNTLWLVAVSSFFTQLKFVVLGIWLLVIPAIIVIRILIKRKRRFQKECNIKIRTMYK